jgi:hypothetical protein
VFKRVEYTSISGEDLSSLNISEAASRKASFMFWSQSETCSALGVLLRKDTKEENGFI